MPSRGRGWDQRSWPGRSITRGWANLLRQISSALEILASRPELEVLLGEPVPDSHDTGGDMAQRPRRRTGPSAAQTRLKELEARLAQLENQLKALHTETAGSVGAARVKLRRIERRAAG